ncbi:Hpt domain-containing protein [uncultured Polaribacter sp.]|uniref:Hpt domain-containing protein n=1 Tax=uncultured Polaribacter sp. TaxID=174711 RepID=UPI0030DD8168
MDIQEILTSNVVDLTSLKEYFSSDKDSLIQLIGVYLSDTTPRVDILEESLTKVDYDSVRSICHFLKSSFGLMGVNCLEEIAALEKQAQSNEPEEVIKERLNFIIPICRASITEYKLILNRLESL